MPPQSAKGAGSSTGTTARDVMATTGAAEWALVCATRPGSTGGPTRASSGRFPKAARKECLRGATSYPPNTSGSSSRISARCGRRRSPTSPDRLRLAAVRDHHERNRDHGRNDDDAEENPAEDLLHLAAGVFTHQRRVSSGFQNWIVRERHDHHAEDDREIHEREWLDADEGKHQRQHEGTHPALGELRHLPRRHVLVPLQSIKLTDVVAARERSLYGRARDAGQDSEQGQTQRR